MSVEKTMQISKRRFLLGLPAAGIAVAASEAPTAAAVDDRPKWKFTVEMHVQGTWQEARMIFEHFENHAIKTGALTRSVRPEPTSPRIWASRYEFLVRGSRKDATKAYLAFQGEVENGEGFELNGDGEFHALSSKIDFVPEAAS
jgi:hypothetical protein